MPQNDISQMKVSDLKRELTLRGLAITGNKIALQERLQTALLESELLLEETPFSEEDLREDVLTDEEERVADEEEKLNKAMKANDEVTATSPSDKNESLKSPTSHSHPQAIAPQQEKIALKRKNSSTEAAKFDQMNVSSGEDSSELEAKILKLEEMPKQVVNISALTQEERLQIRAKKFGLVENTIRHPRVTVVSTDAGLKDVDPKQIEILKKRVERFGDVNSSENKVDVHLEKRFGELLANSGKNKKHGRNLEKPRHQQRMEKKKERIAKKTVPMTVKRKVGNKYAHQVALLKKKNQRFGGKIQKTAPRRGIYAEKTRQTKFSRPKRIVY